MIESCEAETWIYATLAADTGAGGVATLATGGIHAGVAPQGSTSPFVVYNRQGGADVMGLGAQRIMAGMLYQIKAVASGGSKAAAKAIANRIDTLLHAASGTTASGRILSCVRESEVNYVEVDETGERWNHLGGLYRLHAQQL